MIKPEDDTLYRTMASASHHTRSQRGNVLFLILLGVALFAALNYAVTSSMRGEGKSGSSESYELAVTQILQWATTLQHTVARDLPPAEWPRDYDSLDHEGEN
ncbi:hypothetical protein, partial [Sphingobium xenophagum]